MAFNDIQVAQTALPDGPMGAWYAGENAAATRENQDLANLYQALQSQSQFLQNDRYAQETPYEIMSKKLKGESDQALNNSADYMTNIAPTAIAKQQADIATNNDSAGKAKLNMFLRVSDMVMGGASPLDLQLKGFDPELVSRVTQLAASGKLPEVSDHIKANIADNSEVRGKIKETEATGKWHKEVEGMRGANALKLEQAQFEHGKYNKGSKLTLVESLVKNGNYERAATALSLMAMDMPDGPEKEKYLEQAAVYEGLAKDKAAAGKYNPSGVDTAGVTDLPRQQQTPSRLAPPKQGTAENPIKLK